MTFIATVLTCMPSRAPAADASLSRLIMPGPVSAAHAKVEDQCSGCHVAFDKTAQTRVCLACHKPVAQDIVNRAGYHGRLNNNRCNQCHTEHKGRDANILALNPATFNHALTDFALLGKHRGGECGDCHAKKAKFRAAPRVCAGCHTKDDAHGNRLGPDCAQCHDANGWKVTQFDHSRTTFPLGGSHARVQCASCHTQPARTVPARRERLSEQCISCHAKADVHRGSLGTDCQQCHRDTKWQDTKFNHASTGFALLGQHAKTECRDCHRTPGAFKGLSDSCSSCHRQDDKHNGTLGTACENCHTPTAWRPSHGFDHAATRFVLTGKHEATSCKSCHVDALHFKATPMACVACHHADDTHKGRNGTACAECHNTSAWQQTSFDHTKTRFPLRGAHETVECKTCHAGELHKVKPPLECAGCHGVKDPHRGSLGKDCASCHGVQDWKKTRFDHNKAPFMLLGAHAAQTCKACHIDALYRATPARCNDCHAKIDAHHGALGSDCARCHNVRAWPLGTFDHALTHFVLDGGHAHAKCNACHREMSANSLHISTACVSCHAGEDPHEGAFGQQCARCHNTTSFKQVARSATVGPR